MYQSIALWTIRLSVVCYVAAVGLKFCVPGGIPADDARPALRVRIHAMLWMLGAILCVVHVVTALGAFHDFSHAESIRHTAEVTQRVVGIRWGGGVYVNYLFTCLWLVDAIRQIRNLNHSGAHTTSVWLHIFMGFIVFNATAVFGPAWYRWPTAVIVAGMIVARWYRCRR